MRLSEVLVRPKVTEKTNGQIEKQNTIVMPAKSKSRFTKAGFISGRKSSFKKAVVTLAEGENIDLFSF
jgi:large subunit ribosomal protein L23